METFGINQKHYFMAFSSFVSGFSLPFFCWYFELLMAFAGGFIENVILSRRNYADAIFSERVILRNKDDMRGTKEFVAICSPCVKCLS